MKKIMSTFRVLVIALTWPSFCYSNCDSKEYACYKGEWGAVPADNVTVDYKWNWGKARCEPCTSGCGNTFNDATERCKAKGGDHIGEWGEHNSNLDWLNKLPS